MISGGGGQVKSGEQKPGPLGEVNPRRAGLRSGDVTRVAVGVGLGGSRGPRLQAAQPAALAKG